MPFKSDAQRRKFASLVKKGEISQKTFDEWNAATPKNIPERIKPKVNSMADLKRIAKSKMKK
jgi:hypothetical protein